MKATYSLLLLMCGLASLTSCKNEDSIVNGGTGCVPASFSGSISEMTRVSGTSWEANDNIGIFMIQKGAVINGVANYCYTTAAGDGVFSAVNADETIFYPVNKSSVDFIVYHPYRADGGENYIVSNWNSARQDTLDLLVAEARGHSQSNPEAQLSFYHQFSKLGLNISTNNETGLTDADLAGLSIAINGINKPVTFNLLSKTITYSDALNEAVSMQVSENGRTAEAIIPSTQGTSVEITLADGSTYSWDISALSFVSGKKYTYAIILKAATKYVEANLSSIINDWDIVDEKTVDLEVDVVAPTGTHNGHEYVDLGLQSGLKWATCNVGASTPEAYGDYYAWGETEPYYTDGNAQTTPCSSWRTGKSGYNWASYQYCKGTNNTMTKYCVSSSWGTVDNKKVLELADDAANANWGGSWRMPVWDEMNELLTNCTWTWDTINDINGFTITGPNGNSIFLPAAGCRSDNYLSVTGTSGCYWSSTLRTQESRDGLRLLFNSGYHEQDIYSRYCGHSVRPVFSNN